MNENDYCAFLIDESFRSFGLPLAILALILTAWLIHLIVRPGPFSSYIAFVAATFFPTALGFFSIALGLVRFLQRITNGGGGGPGSPTWQDCAFEDWCMSLIVGTSLTCLFLPLGLALVWLRKPKLAAEG